MKAIMSSKRLLTLLSLAGIFSFSSACVYAEQLTQQGLVSWFIYTTGNQPKLDLSIDNNGDGATLSGYSLDDSNKNIETLKEAVDLNTPIQVKYDTSTKEIYSLKTLQLSYQPIDNKSKRQIHKNFSTGVSCWGVDIVGGGLKCHFTDNNGIEREFRGVYGSASIPSIGGMGGKLNMDNLPTDSYISCTFNFQSYIFYFRVNFSCDGGKKGYINAGGLKAPGAAWGSGVISQID